MSAIDMQTCTSTKEGIGRMIRDDGILKELTQYFRSPGDYFKTEEEFIQGLRENDVQTVTCSGTWKFMGWTDFDLIKERNNYLGHLIKDYPDAVLSAWVSLDSDWGLKGLRELERCIKDLGTYGIAVCGSMSNTPANDESFYPFYELCIEANVPVKIWVGHIAVQGRGLRLWTENPIPNVDDVAADFPELKIICAHHPWPFHNEMASVLIHHPNVYNEQHGWSPKYFPETFKKDINSRLQDKIVFGSDYPYFSYKRLFPDWEAEGFKPEVLEKVFHKNAERVLGLK
ncbi:MAG: amidohydrolase [Deltaproteobacteria bacterium CG12_big_fil_rev_8_21_14_0_65_43_10]|nr:MAG: hypothetical protein AUK23_06125 [Deltaproteobacteria bacterium CG2_30_43_15]PIQ46173.1 MAG: amidohydrolase [Deltaproteobacteria bacterium CG12_big_fil_rev_8_21_14_0_65_43_10]PIU86711.1 MAG: amidohydrolase [Deltaproteobacteria bacterium CG06_land_8_20_14_3_00_44_19]PIX22211.1 MAG: amidohydrolase [Deltaproteobacteria bacterium CG_4_8_14_3_um_filter_43_13]PIZ21151.1 MAG: amidohydrolase [Deltaproteobacteria bacterium CG_4_10_14_0_8_um_filter_43_12]HCX89931.1 amidohydrolase [Deltaproteobac